jgi:cytidylate kinase
LREIEERDARDSERASSPLRQASDALAMDTTSLTAEEAAERVVEMFRQRVAGH